MPGGLTMTLRAFIAGATGYTGRYVVSELRDLGVETIAHIRPESSTLEEARQSFEALGAQVDTTPWTEEAMVARFCELQPSVVFALLGTTRKRAHQEGKLGRDVSYASVDYGLTSLLIRAAQASSSCQRFVYLSAVGVKPTSSVPYLKARALAEAELQQSALPYTIARPSLITGQDRLEHRRGERIASVLSGGLLTAAGWLGARKFRDRYQALTGQVLARGLIRVATDPGCENQIVHTEELA